MEHAGVDANRNSRFQHDRFGAPVARAGRFAASGETRVIRPAAFAPVRDVDVFATGQGGTRVVGAGVRVVAGCVVRGCRAGPRIRVAPVRGACEFIGADDRRADARTDLALVVGRALITVIAGGSRKRLGFRKAGVGCWPPGWQIEAVHWFSTAEQSGGAPGAQAPATHRSPSVHPLLSALQRVFSLGSGFLTQTKESVPVDLHSPALH